MKKKVKATAVFLAMLLFVSMVSCGAPPGESQTPGDAQPAAAKPGEKVYVISGAIPDPATFIANQHSEAGTGNFGDLAYEGLIRYQRGTDDIENQLAESYTNEGNKTVFKLRPGVKYNDGEDFTSKDIWSFYAINPNTPVQYLESVETPDDLTVEFVWREPAPAPDMRIMLIAREIHHARAPYHIYGEYADQLSKLWDQLPLLSQKQIDEGVTAPWGRDKTANPEVSAEIDRIYKDYCNHEEAEHYVIGTGPYVNVLGHTVNEAAMVPNPYYWNKDIELFDKIIIKKTTDATKASMMISEEIDYMGGTLPKDLTDNILSSNENVVYYPMEDAAGQGVYFNTQSKTSPMDKIEFRQALNYIVEREALRDIGSYQSKVNPYSTTVIPTSMLSKYMDDDVMARMREYTTDHDKATQLLESIGCEKKDGTWNNPDGTPIKLVIGIDKNWYVATLVAPALASQLNQFGLTCEVNAVDGSVFGTQAEQEHAFDMTWDWMNIAWTFSSPYFCLTDFYKATAGPFKKMNLPFDEERTLATLELQDWDGNTFNPWSWTEAMLRETDEAVNREHWEKMIWAANENAFGINFYQNVTGSWENLAAVSNLPMLDKITEDRWMPFPETEEDKIAVYNLNDGFSGYIRKMSMLQPIPDETTE